MFLFIISISLAFLQGILFALFSHLMLTVNLEKKQYLYIWFAPCAWVAIGQIFLMKSLSGSILTYVVWGILWILILNICYGGSWLEKGHALLSISFAYVLADEMYSLLIASIGQKPVAGVEVSFERIGKLIIIWTIQFMIGLIILMVSQYISKKKTFTSMIPMFLLPFSQLFYMLGCLKVDYIKDTYYAIFLLLGQVIGSCISMYWLYWVCAENKQKELEAKMKDIQKTMEKKKAHYQEIEQRRETLNGLRKDMSLQIQEVQLLVEQKNREDAVKILDELTDMLHATKEYTFCPVPIINAVLDEKGKECKELEIDFQVDIKIPYHTDITEMAYCSIFSNLMDNAIRGAKEYAMETGIPGYIKISAIYEGGFCVIKTVNNSKKPEKRLRKGHGKGTVILRDIAEYYGGSYEASFDNDVYTAIVTLRK